VSAIADIMGDPSNRAGGNPYLVIKPDRALIRDHNDLSGAYVWPREGRPLKTFVLVERYA
jgi:hypothetical protein